MAESDICSIWYSEVNGGRRSEVAELGDVDLMSELIVGVRVTARGLCNCGDSECDEQGLGKVTW